MYRIVLSSFALFVGCGMTLFAQNLIPNPSFEDCTSPPDAECRLDKVKGGWFNPVGRDDGYPYASPDYKSAKGSNQAKLPKSYHGYTEPQEGSAVVGLIPYAGWINDYREYVAVKLVQPLATGTTYRCSFYITNGEEYYYCNGAIDKMGVSFTMNKPKQSGYEPIRAKTQYEIQDVLWTKNWRKLTFTFTADQAYAYMTIGCFHSDSEITYKRMSEDKSNSMTSEGAYYFIDNFSLVEASEEEPIASVEPPRKKESGGDRLNAMRSQLGGAEYEAEQKRKAKEAEELRLAEAKRTKAEEEAKLAEQKRKIMEQRAIEAERRQQELQLAEAKRQEEARNRAAEKPADPNFTLQKVEKTRYTPNRVAERRVEKQNTVEVSSRTLTLQVYDARAEDRDTVSMSWNGEWILQRQMVKNKPIEITITLDEEGNNTLIFFAHNLGFIPPNTAVVAYTEGGKRKVIEVESDLKRCGAIEFKLKQ